MRPMPDRETFLALPPEERRALAQKVHASLMEDTTAVFKEILAEDDIPHDDPAYVAMTEFLSSQETEAGRG